MYEVKFRIWISFSLDLRRSTADVIPGYVRCEERLNQSKFEFDSCFEYTQTSYFHELNSLNSIRLMWSKASEPGLRWSKGTKCAALPCDRVLTSSCSMQDWLIVLGSYFVRPRVARLKHVLLLSNPTPKKQNKESNICIPDCYWNAKGDLFISYNATENTKNKYKFLQYQGLISWEDCVVQTNFLSELHSGSCCYSVWSPFNTQLKTVQKYFS